MRYSPKHIIDPTQEHLQRLSTIHLRFACASTAVLKQTHQHVRGMTVQQGTWKDLQSKLPCNACLAGKMTKAKKSTSRDYIDIGNLATLSNVPLSWNPSTDKKITQPNLKVAVDWGMCVYRRNVCFNERSFPARQRQLNLKPNQDTGADLVGLQFVDEGTSFIILETDVDTNGGGNILTYEDIKTKEKHYSTVKEVRPTSNNQ
jgi:hypothetical protein